MGCILAVTIMLLKIILKEKDTEEQRWWENEGLLNWVADEILPTLQKGVLQNLAEVQPQPFTGFDCSHLLFPGYRARDCRSISLGPEECSLRADVRGFRLCCARTEGQIPSNRDAQVCLINAVYDRGGPLKSVNQGRTSVVQIWGWHCLWSYSYSLRIHFHVFTFD